MGIFYILSSHSSADPDKLAFKKAHGELKLNHKHNMTNTLNQFEPYENNEGKYRGIYTCGYFI